ncbi:MAG TPA: glycosyltransferase family 4 protein [Ilumatobacteraceae bacterium]|nr:glycosyltransferase family 4 protein [Ilumatobacteraceae bacterium]
MASVVESMGEGYGPRLGQTVPMRIVLVVPGGVDPPGSERVIPFIHGLVADLSSRHDVLVIALGHDPQPGTWKLFDATVVNVPIGAHSKADIARVVRTVNRLAAEDGRPDVVHGLWANLPGLAASIAARRHGRPSVVSVCGGEFASLADIGYGGGLGRGTLLMARASTRSASAVSVATTWMQQHVTERGGRVHEVIPLGADTSIFEASEVPASPNRLVHIGNINRVKDQAMLLRAFRIVLDTNPSATLDIAGLDTLGGEMQALAATLGIDNSVRFRGYVQPHQLASMLGDAAVHVLASRHDAGPLAVLEAAACGVPTVGTSVGHVADFAAMPQPAAVAAHAHRPEVLADGVISLIADEPRRRAIAERAHAWAMAHDSMHTSNSFEALYRRLIASR